MSSLKTLVPCLQQCFCFHSILQEFQNQEIHLCHIAPPFSTNDSNHCFYLMLEEKKSFKDYAHWTPVFDPFMLFLGWLNTMLLSIRPQKNSYFFPNVSCFCFLDCKCHHHPSNHAKLRVASQPWYLLYSLFQPLTILPPIHSPFYIFSYLILKWHHYLDPISSCPPSCIKTYFASNILSWSIHTNFWNYKSDYVTCFKHSVVSSDHKRIQIFKIIYKFYRISVTCLTSVTLKNCITHCEPHSEWVFWINILVFLTGMFPKQITHILIYERFASICHPLSYSKIMKKKTSFISLFFYLCCIFLLPFIHPILFSTSTYHPAPRKITRLLLVSMTFFTFFFFFY